MQPVRGYYFGHLELANLALRQQFPPQHNAFGELDPMLTQERFAEASKRQAKRINRFYNGTSKYKPRVDTPKRERTKH